MLYWFQVILDETEQVMVKEGDKIGWTNEAEFGVVSFRYAEGHKTNFRKVKGSMWPVLGNEYVFGNIHLPSTFSVAVEVDPHP